MDIQSKRLVVGGAVAAGAMLVVAGMVIGAGLAKADPAWQPDNTKPWSGPLGDQNIVAFWNDIAREAHGTVDDARLLADTICSHLRSGTPESHVIAEMAHEDQHNVGNVTYIIHAAEWHFCPEKY